MKSLLRTQKEVKLFINNKRFLPIEVGTFLFNRILISLKLLRTDYLMVLLLCSAVSYIFEHRAYQLCFQILSYVFLGMWIISRDSHIYMQRFVLPLHHVILTSSYIEDNERLLYEIHFTMTTFTVLAYKHFTFLPFTSNIGLPQSGQDFVEMLSCLYFYHSI